MLNEIVRRYQSFNPVTGDFDRPRGLREYAREIGVSPGQLSRIINDLETPGRSVLERLARTFRPAGEEIGRALSLPAEMTA